MNALVIGSGGRESAIVWKIRQSPQIDRVFCVPTAKNNLINAQLVDYAPSDFRGVAEFVRTENIDMVVVGPEEPLVNGIVDYLRGAGITNVFGPSRSAAIVEGSKIFAKKFMARHSILTAPFEVAESSENACKIADYFIETHGSVVVKADGLYSGKGVFVCDAKDEAHAALNFLFSSKNPAGHNVVLEEKLKGKEASVFVFSDGNTFSVIPVAVRDYKRAFNNDEGQNTGGMGAVAPVSAGLEKIISSIIVPTFLGFRKEGITYKGVLYLGVMFTEEGPAVIEYNCRLGDPEAQVLLPLMKTDLVSVMQSCIDGNLRKVALDFSNEAACTVVLASKGYPGDYEAGVKVHGLNDVDNDVLVFPSAIYDGKTAGGRVLSITAKGPGIEIAREKVYSCIGMQGIHFEGMEYRGDIGA